MLSEGRRLSTKKTTLMVALANIQQKKTSCEPVLRKSPVGNKLEEIVFRVQSSERNRKNSCSHQIICDNGVYIHVHNKKMAAGRIFQYQNLGVSIRFTCLAKSLDSSLGIA